MANKFHQPYPTFMKPQVEIHICSRILMIYCNQKLSLQNDITWHLEPHKSNQIPKVHFQACQQPRFVALWHSFKCEDWQGFTE